MKEKTPATCKHGDILLIAPFNPNPIMIGADIYFPTDSWCCNKKVWIGWLLKKEAKEFCKDCKLFKPLLEESK